MTVQTSDIGSLGRLSIVSGTARSARRYASGGRAGPAIDEIANALSYMLRYQGRKRVHHADDAMAQILTDMPNAVEMAWSESVNQVPRRSRFAFASVVSVAVGCASNRRRSIGSPVSSQ